MVHILQLFIVLFSIGQGNMDDYMTKIFEKAIHSK